MLGVAIYQDIEYIYNAMGQRIVKIVKPHKKSGSVAVLAPQSEWEYTFYQLDAMGNVLATYRREYELVSGTTYKSKYGLEEQYIYGSSRLGSIEQNQPDFESTFTATITTTGADDDDEYFVLTGGFSSNAYEVNPGTSGVYEEYDHKTGWRHYEQTNHLGNVMSTICDRKVPVDRYNFINTGGSYTHGLSSVMGTYVTGATTLTHKIGTGTDGTADGWMAEVQSYGDYYAFGMMMDGRKSSPGNYRYGYQGQEMDNEVKGEGNSLNYEYRMHDPRLGRFFAIDPLESKYPYNSPYAFCENDVIAFVELEGLEKAKKQIFYGGGTKIQVHNCHEDMGPGWKYPGQTWEEFKAKHQGMCGFFTLVKTVGIGVLIFTNPAVGVPLAVTDITGAPVTPSPAALEATTVSNLSKLEPEVAVVEEEITLYRGVNENHTGYQNAVEGKAIPRGGKATPLEHNTKTTESEYTSWSTDEEVAKNFALRPKGEGVVLQKTVPKSQTVTSPNLKKVVLKQSGKIVSESEVLLKGAVIGAIVTKVK